MNKILLLVIIAVMIIAIIYFIFSVNQSFIISNDIQRIVIETKDGGMSNKSNKKEISDKKTISLLNNPLSRAKGMYGMPACPFEINIDLYEKDKVKKIIFSVDDCGTFKTGDKYFVLLDKDIENFRKALRKLGFKFLGDKE